MTAAGLTAIALIAGVSSQYMPEAPNQYPDPALCQVVVEDMGNVGFRIADAQQLAERGVSALRKRMGNERVIYEGLLKNAKAMKKMLGKGSETQIQDDQIAYYTAASKAAKWRVRIRFGKKRGRHWVKVSCRKSGTSPKKAEQSRTFKGKRFDQVRDEFAEEMKTFCSVMDPPPPEPEKPAVPPGQRKKKKKDWKMPPMRR